MMASQEITLLSSRGALLLFALFSFGLCIDGCDIGDCNSVFQAVFTKLISNDIDSLCRDSKQVSKCLNECQQVFFPHYLDINTTISLFKEICDEEFVYDVADHWECIRNHLNKFFVCVARYSSIKSSSGNNNGKLISCRRKLMIFDCSEEVFLNRCEDEAVQIVSKKFKTALKLWLNSSCYGIPQNKVYDLDVYPGLKSDFDATASCMDSYSYLAQDCFSDYLEKAVHSENHCWKDTTVVCNKPSSSIPCSPLSSVANFYSSLFSFGKLDCVEPSTVFITKTDTINPTINSSNPDDYGEPNSSTQSMQPPSSSMDSADAIYFPETKPPISITDFKPNDNILPFNHMQDGYFTPTDNINTNFSLFDSSLNVTSSEDVISFAEDGFGSQFNNDESVASHSQCSTCTLTLLFLSYIFVIFCPN